MRVFFCAIILLDIDEEFYSPHLLAALRSAFYFVLYDIMKVLNMGVSNLLAFLTFHGILYN